MSVIAISQYLPPIGIAPDSEPRGALHRLVTSGAFSARSDELIDNFLGALNRQVRLERFDVQQDFGGPRLARRERPIVRPRAY